MQASSTVSPREDGQPRQCMYRIHSEEDLYACSFYDYLDEGAAVAVEWSENIIDFLEPPYILVEIERQNGDERKITITGANNL